MRVVCAVAVLGLAAAILVPPVGARGGGGGDAPATAERSGEYPPGESVERIACTSDPEQTYALYLPTRYRSTTEWPLLILMDPRGRAMVPLERVQAAAERHGFIVASSYNTLSDGPPEPNLEAVGAIVDDTQRRLSIDTRRFYLVGFSGTARISWIFGYRMHGHVAGVIGFGAGLPHTIKLAETVTELGTPFVFYGGAGVLDFNYEEVRALDRSLDALGVVHRIEFYDGPHAWPPGEVFDHAVAWMVLQAMKSGLRPRRQEWLEAEFRRRTAAAAAAAENGDALVAWGLYRSAASDFSGLREIGELEARAAELGKSKAVRRAMRRQENLEAEHREWVGRLRAFLDDYRTADPLPQHKDAIYRLRIAALQRQADKAPDSAEGLAARRRLALAFVQTSFYQPRDYLRAGDPRRAEGVLLIAAAIRPGDPNVCLQLARAQAQLGRKAAALENLRCAADSGRLGPDRIEADELLAPLRGEPGYREILKRLRGNSG